MHASHLPQPTIPKQQRLVALYGATAVHASFGDIELAQITLRGEGCTVVALDMTMPPHAWRIHCACSVGMPNPLMCAGTQRVCVREWTLTRRWRTQTFQTLWHRRRWGPTFWCLLCLLWPAVCCHRRWPLEGLPSEARPPVVQMLIQLKRFASNLRQTMAQRARAQAVSTLGGSGAPSSSGAGSSSSSGRGGSREAVAPGASSGSRRPGLAGYDDELAKILGTPDSDVAGVDTSVLGELWPCVPLPAAACTHARVARCARPAPGTLKAPTCLMAWRHTRSHVCARSHPAAGGAVGSWRTGAGGGALLCRPGIRLPQSIVQLPWCGSCGKKCTRVLQISTALVTLLQLVRIHVLPARWQARSVCSAGRGVGSMCVAAQRAAVAVAKGGIDSVDAPVWAVASAVA